MLVPRNVHRQETDMIAGFKGMYIGHISVSHPANNSFTELQYEFPEGWLSCNSSHDS